MRFAVWAPLARTVVDAACSGGERVRDARRRRRLVGVGATRRTRRPRTRSRIDDGEPRADPRALRAAGRARGAGRSSSTATRSRRRTSPGAASSSPARSSTSCTSARSRPSGTLDAAIERLDHLVDARRRHRRGDAARDLPGPPRLGVRRRRPVRRARALRRAVRVPALRRRLPRARPRRLPRRRLQPPRAERQPPRASSARTSPTATARPGARRSTSTAPAATRCGASSSTTR